MTTDAPRQIIALHGAPGASVQSLLADFAARGVVLARAARPVGVALVRRFGRGWSIGPVIAPDAQGARTLISHWLGRKMGKFCRLDVTLSGGLSEWLGELGLPRVGEVVTMVHGAPLPVGGDAAEYALVSQALG